MYDFKSLSYYDFEILVRDLLQKHLKVFMESFKSGRDEGIDLRYSITRNNKSIVQCKHYAESGMKELRKVLKEEVIKLNKIKPVKYILATSVNLSPKYKDEIIKILHPYCKSADDIYGCAELNNLLNLHKDIEKAHYKLWLTSVNVLERIIHSKIYKESEIGVEQLQSKMRLYVQNKSYSEAHKIMSDHNYCIISGVPGIGKTFLADVLLADYIRHDYEPFIISQNISEAFGVLKADTAQVFYYDDFLGQTGLDDKLDKNEDKSLLRLIEHAKNSTNIKLILTTREYILQAAKMLYERLGKDEFTYGKCIIELDKYTRENRSKILYNHLYFSSMPKEILDQIGDNNVVLRIIDHENYSPRIIESMCKAHVYTKSTPTDFAMKFLSVLDNPTLLWSHAFENQIAYTSKCILCVLASIRGAIRINDLEEAFWEYIKVAKLKYSATVSADSFTKGIKELDGSFIRTERRDKTTFVGFHNPSILDFIESHLSNNKPMISDLLAASVFYEQFITLNRLYDKKISESKVAQELVTNIPLLSETIKRTISRPISKVSIVSKHGKSTVHSYHSDNTESNILHALRLLKSVDYRSAEPTIRYLLSFAINTACGKNSDYNKLLEIAITSRISKFDILLTNKLATTVANLISFDPDDDMLESSTLDIISNLYEHFADLLPKDYYTTVADKITHHNDVVFDYDISSASDESELEDLRTLAEKIAEQFCVDMHYIYKRIDDKVDELRYNMSEPYDDREDSYDDKPDVFSNEDIFDMFSTLHKH